MHSKQRSTAWIVLLLVLGLGLAALAWTLGLLDGKSREKRPADVASSGSLLFYMLTALQTPSEQSSFLGPQQHDLWRQRLKQWTEEASAEDALLHGLVGDRDTLFNPAQVSFITGRRGYPRRKDLKQLVASLEQVGPSPVPAQATDASERLVGPEIGSMHRDVIVSNLLLMCETADLALSSEQARRLLPPLRRWLAVRNRMDFLVDQLAATLTQEQMAQLQQLYDADTQADLPATSSELELARNTLNHGQLGPPPSTSGAPRPGEPGQPGSLQSAPARPGQR